MKKRLFANLLCLFALFCCAACKKEQENGVPPEEVRVEYEGVYRARSVEFGGFKLNLGEENLLLGKLTKDVAVLTLGEDRSLRFHCKLLVVSFDVTGVFEVDEKDDHSILAIIEGDESSRAEIPATCDGKTLEITYEEVKFTLEKD